MKRVWAGVPDGSLLEDLEAGLHNVHVGEQGSLHIFTHQHLNSMM
jgi:hypothetical protein